jgi:KDO2-lipid IV(A) lauroyltransferase
MHRKRWKKRLKRGPGAWAAFVGLGCLYLALHLVSTDAIPVIGRWVGGMMACLAGPRRRIAMKNITLALGSSLGLETRRRLVKRLIQGLGLNLAELGHPGFMQIDFLRKRVPIQGLEHLEEALSKGRGAILASAHFGNFPLILARLGLEGYPVGVIIRDPRHKPVARFLDQWRARYNVRTLRDKPRWASVKEALALLRQNGILVVHVDLNVSEGGLFVPFFGHWVPTFRGPAMLALRSGTPLLPTFIKRLQGLDHRLSIHPPVQVQLTGNRDQDTWQMLLALNQEAEKTIREYPEQWWWIHRRFRKAKPASEVGGPIPLESA